MTFYASRCYLLLENPGAEGCVVLVAPSHPLCLLAFWCEVGFPFNPIKVKLLAGDLRAAQS